MHFWCVCVTNLFQEEKWNSLWRSWVVSLESRVSRHNGRQSVSQMIMCMRVHGRERSQTNKQLQASLKGCCNRYNVLITPDGIQSGQYWTKYQKGSSLSLLQPKPSSPYFDRIVTVASVLWIIVETKSHGITLSHVPRFIHMFHDSVICHHDVFHTLMPFESPMGVATWDWPPGHLFFFFLRGGISDSVTQIPRKKPVTVIKILSDPQILILFNSSSM